MLYVWPDGTVSDETSAWLSDDYFTIGDDLTLREVKELVFRHFAFVGKDGQRRTEQAASVLAVVAAESPHRIAPDNLPG